MTRTLTELARWHSNAVIRRLAVWPLSRGPGRAATMDVTFEASSAGLELGRRRPPGVHVNRAGCQRWPTQPDLSCGCGNFLYVAYRELRGLEQELKEKITTTAAATGVPAPSGTLPFYPLNNLHGIDIEGIAVLIARLTLWMGQRQMIDRYGVAEDPLPLVDMSSIRRADAPAAECAPTTLGREVPHCLLLPPASPRVPRWRPP